jgi:hypothetical protein
MTGKLWLTSKTVLVNTAAAIVAAVTPDVQAYIIAHPKLAIAIGALVNIVLRFATNQAVH